MIKNIIFDLAGVLLEFNVSKFLKSNCVKDDKISLFKNLIFGSNEWIKGDKGELTYSEIIDSICENNPNYSNELRYILEHKDLNILISENKLVTDYLKELKNKGYKIFILSNVTKDDINEHQKRFDFFKLIDGAVYSAEIGYIKPDKECYEILLEKYNLKPNECIFIDDMITNVEAANKIGINGVLFNNLEDVKEKIESIINSEK